MLSKREANILREGVSNVVSGWYVLELDFFIQDQIANPMIADTDVFRSSLDHMVVGKGDGGLVIAVDCCGVLLVTDFGEQLSQPHDFFETIGDGDVLCFSA